MTDGQDTCNARNKLTQSQESLKQFFSDQSTENSVNTRVYTLGFSQHHDANMLNFFAQCGSQLGNFIFIDTNNNDYEDQMN